MIDCEAGAESDGPTPSGPQRLDALRAQLAARFDDPAVPDEVVSRAAAAVRSLYDIDPSTLDAVATRTWLEGIEQVRRSVEAAAAAAAGAIDRANPFRPQGFFSAKAVVKHMCRLSGPEAHRRIQAARLHGALDEWAQAEADGDVGGGRRREGTRFGLLAAHRLAPR